MLGLLANSTQEAMAGSMAKSMFYQQLAGDPSKVSNIAVSYWIELRRKGVLKKVDSRFRFKAGDMIKFHATSDVDGYAHIVMLEGSSGAKSVLFPVAGKDASNVIRRGKDYAIPSSTFLVFDKNPGREHIRFALSRKPVKTAEFLKPQATTQLAMAEITENPAIDPTGGNDHLLVAFPEDSPTPAKAPSAEAPASQPDDAIKDAIPNEEYGKDLFRADSVPARPKPAVTPRKPTTTSTAPRVRRRRPAGGGGTAQVPTPPPTTVVMNTNANEDLYVDIALEHD